MQYPVIIAEKSGTSSWPSSLLQIVYVYGKHGHMQISNCVYTGVAARLGPRGSAEKYVQPD